MLSPGKYFKEVIDELQRVTWPSRQQTIEMTILVVGVSVIVGSYIGLLDFGFSKMLEQILLQP